MPSRSWLEITGSIHCNSHGGKNTNRFTYDQLYDEIQLLVDTFNIDPELTEIHTLEVGMNLYVLFAVFPFLKNCLLQFNNKSFDRMGKIGFHIADRSQGIPKLYAKASQVLRWEMKFIKMQPVLRHLKKEYEGLCLADLGNQIILDKLFQLLLKSWDQVLLCDDDIDIDSLPVSPADKELMRFGCMKDYWTKLKGNGTKDYEHFRYKKDRFTDLTKQFGKDMHSQIKELLVNEYDLLSNLSRNLPTAHNHRFPVPTVYMVDRIRESDNITNKEIININNKGSLGKEAEKLIKRCRCCGRDISHQKKSSVYCSIKFFPLAKQCRNKISNQKNNPKRKRARVADELISQALSAPSPHERIIKSKLRLEELRSRMRANGIIK